MNKLAITMLAGLVLTTGTVALLGQAPVTEKLASGTYIVYAPSPQIWRVKIDPKAMGNATISGHFAVTEGTPKTLDVLVFNEENYTKWKDEDRTVRAAAKPLASVVRKSEGDISAKLTDAGYHYLVISDRHEYEGKKTVVADFKLQYDKR
jgi:hypothetical protein